MTDIANSRELKALQNLEDALNTYSWNPEKFAASIPTMHRTLQQTFFRTIVASIRFMASDNFGYDLRNQAAHEGAKKIVESGVLNDIALPNI